jgi:hypothetical protein
MGRITYETFCGSIDAQETVADALSTVIAEAYSRGKPVDATHTLREPHCDIATWTLNYFFALDGMPHTRPMMSKHDVGVFGINGGVGWHALLEGLPRVGLGKYIEPTYSQFFDLVGLDVEGYKKVTDEYPNLYPKARIAVIDAKEREAFVAGVTEQAVVIAAMTDRRFDIPTARKTHGMLVGKSRDVIAATYSSIWDMRNYEPVAVVASNPREELAWRLAQTMTRLIT